MRNEIKVFAEEMETIMQKHDAVKQESWKTCDIDFLVDKLGTEIKEWIDSAKHEELIDIANMCMMVWNRIIYVDGRIPRPLG